MPCYKTPPIFLKRSLESILSQTYNNLESIVVFDPSKSEIDKDILHVFEEFKDDKRLKIVLHKRKKGLVYSLNEAILLSKGKYIARADADDINMRFRIERQISFMRDKKYHIVGSWAFLIDEKSRKLLRVETPVTPEEIRSKIMLHNPFLHPSVIIRKSVLRNVGLYDFKFENSEDYELWMRIISKGYIGANYPNYLLMIRKYNFSLTRGSKMLLNRCAYLKSKIFAYKHYQFNKKMDLAYLAVSPLVFLCHPKFEVPMKKLMTKLFCSGYNGRL